MRGDAQDLQKQETKRAAEAEAQVVALSERNSVR